jgi:hypothetical protein
MTHKNFSKFTKLLEIYSRTNSGNNFQEIGSGSFGKVHPVIRFMCRARILKYSFKELIYGFI